MKDDEPIILTQEEWDWLMKEDPEEDTRFAEEWIKKLGPREP